MKEITMIDGVVGATALSGDRGLHYGDGVFETMAVRGGQVRHWDRHMARLQRGCAVLHFAAPDAHTLQADINALALADECVLKLIVTRGDGRRGYAPSPQSVTRRIWQVAPWPDTDPDLYAQGAVLTWLDTKVARQPALAGIKHLNRLEQVLAARELAATDAYEGLVCDDHGHVIEAVSANVFMVRDHTLYTPDLTLAGVAGVLRELILELADGLLPVEVVPLRRADFAFADEVFLTNSIRGVVPVVRVDSVSYRRGTVVDQLCAALAGAATAQLA